MRRTQTDLTGEADGLARRGLEILYAKPGRKGDVLDVTEHDLTGELTRIMHQGPDPGRDTRASVW